MEKIFIENLKEALEIEDRDIAMSDEFTNYDEWNSLAYLSVIAMLDEEYEVQIENAEFKKMKTVSDLFEAVNKN